MCNPLHQDTNNFHHTPKLSFSIGYPLCPSSLCPGNYWSIQHHCLLRMTYKWNYPGTHFIYFWLIYIISFLLFVFGLFTPNFSSFFFKLRLRLLIWDIFFFCISVNIILAISYKFWWVAFLIFFSSKYFFISLETSSFMYGYFTMCFIISKISKYLLLWVSHLIPYGIRT